MAMQVVLSRNLQLTDAEKAKMMKRRAQVAGGTDSAKSGTKKVPNNGLNVNVIIINVHKIAPKDAKKSPPTNVTLFVRPFDKTILDGLPSAYYRWNEEEGCVELATQRHLDADQARSITKQSEYYPDKPEEFKWVKLKPGSLITLADFKHQSVKEDSLRLGKIYDLAPRTRKEKEKTAEEKEADKDKKEYAKQDWGWHWFKVTPEKDVNKRLQLSALACVRDFFPQEAFFFEDQRFPQTSQSAAIINVVPQWDEAAIVLTLRSGTYAIGSWFKIEDKPEYWAMTPKEPNDKSVRLPNANPTDKTAWTTKALRGFIMVDQALNFHTQKVVVNFAINDKHIEANFCVKDLGVWYYVMRFVIPSLPFMAFCSINDQATKAALQNQAKENAGHWHAPDEDAAMKDKTSAIEDDEQPAAAEAAEAAPILTEEGADGEAHIDFRQMFKARQTQNEVAGSSEKVDVDADFAVIAYCNNLLFNAAAIYRMCLFPVPANWPLTPAPESGKQAALQPYLRVDKNPNGKFEEHGKLELGMPKELDEVICVTDYTTGDIDEDLKMMNKFIQLVKAGKGEWRVAVNSPEYSDMSKAQEIFYLASKATPAQGAQFLDKGSATLDADTPDELTITWTPVPFERRRYALFYINLLRGGNLEAEKAKAREALSTGGYAKAPPSAAGVAASPAVQRPTLQLTHDPEKVSGVSGSVSAPIKQQPSSPTILTQKTSKVTEVGSEDEASHQNLGDESEEKSTSKHRKDKSEKKHRKKH